MIRRLLISAVLLLAGFARADWSADRDGSAGYVTVTVLATAVDEAVPFFVVYGSDLPSEFHAAMDAAGDTDGKTIRVSTADGVTQLACVPIGVDTGTDTFALPALGTGMSASSDVDYRIYVGNASLTMPTASGGMGEQAVFAAYVSVYFPGVDVRDWTAGGRTLTAVNTPGTAASGYEGITAATYVAASSQYHKYEGTQAVTDWPITLETLGYANNLTGDHGMVSLSDVDSSFSIAGLYFSGTSSDKVRGFYGGASGTSAIATSTAAYLEDTWQYVASTRDANIGTSKAYLEGATGVNSTTTIATPDFDRLGIGARISSTVTWKCDGMVAVTLLSASVRSANYIATMQDNWAGTMYSAGAWTANAGTTGHPWFYWRYRA